MEKIKFYTFENLNAPMIENDFGSIIDVLDKCLVGGFSSATPIAVNVSEGVATITFAAAHKYMQFQWLALSGFSSQKFNDEHRILSVSTNSVSFLIDIPDGDYPTSGVSVKLAALGWSKPYEATGKAVYQAKDVDKNPFYLRVDASKDPVWTAGYSKYAKVGILETCAGIEDLTGVQAPYNQNNPLKNWTGTGAGASAINGWAKWYTAIHESYITTGRYYESSAPTNGSRKWALVGNDSGFYFIPYQTVGDFYATVYGFDVVEKNHVNTPILFASLRDLAASAELISISSITDTSNIGVISTQNINGEKINNFGSLFVDFNQRYSGQVNAVANDNNGLLLAQFKVKDGSGYFAGTLTMPHSVLYQVNTGDLVTIQQDNGEAFLLCRTSSGSNLKGAVAFYLGGVSL